MIHRVPHNIQSARPHPDVELPGLLHDVVQRPEHRLVVHAGLGLQQGHDAIAVAPDADRSQPCRLGGSQAAGDIVGGAVVQVIIRVVQ